MRLHVGQGLRREDAVAPLRGLHELDQGASGGLSGRADLAHSSDRLLTDR